MSQRFPPAPALRRSPNSRATRSRRYTARWPRWCAPRLVEKTGRGQYILGDEFLRLAFAHHEARPDHIRVRPILERLAARFGETAHYAVLDGDSIVYRAKVDPTVGAVRLELDDRRSQSGARRRGGQGAAGSPAARP